MVTFVVCFILMFTELLKSIHGKTDRVTDYYN